MKTLFPYLQFLGNCREAMEFYKSALGGELTLTTVGETPSAGQMPGQNKDSIMHSTLKGEGWIIAGSDMMLTNERTNGNANALTIDCSSEDEIKTIFGKLSAGGNVIFPLRTEFWGATFGQLIDKYGNRWMLNYEKKA